jgi:hypothetical protein
MVAYKRNSTAKVAYFFQRLGPERSFLQALHITTLGLQLQSHNLNIVSCKVT